MISLEPGTYVIHAIQESYDEIESLFTVEFGMEALAYEMLDSDVNVLFVGNSLLLGMNRQAENHHFSYGMCATSHSKDYYWLVKEAMLAKYPSASFSRLFGVPFETLGSTDDYSTLWNTEVNDYTGAPMSESFRSDLDLIIIQLGDNANTADRRVAFAANIDPFICDIRSACPDARIIWVDSWYQYVRVHPIILAACTSWGIEEVDIHSTKSSETMATSGQSYENEYGRTSTVSDKWITHPGDAGMAAIANIIIEALGL